MTSPNDKMISPNDTFTTDDTKTVSRVLHQVKEEVQTSSTSLEPTPSEGGTLEPTRSKRSVKVEGLSTYEKWRHLHQLRIQHSQVKTIGRDVKRDNVNLVKRKGISKKDKNAVRVDSILETTLDRSQELEKTEVEKG